MELADRSRRLLATLTDIALLAVPYLIGASEVVPEPLRIVAAAGLLALTGLQLVWLGRDGQTLGKRLTGIRIVRKDSLENGGFVVNVLKRGLISGLLDLLPGYFLVDSLFIFRGDRRCLHDLIAGTCVINARRRPVLQ